MLIISEKPRILDERVLPTLVENILYSFGVYCRRVPLYIYKPFYEYFYEYQNDYL